MDGIDGISQLLGPLRGLDPPARGSEVLLDFDEEQAQIVNQVASRGFPFLLAFFFAFPFFYSFASSGSTSMPFFYGFYAV